MKKLKLFLGMTAVLLLVTLTAFKCGSENAPVNTNNLQGTKWKLEGIVNEQTGEMQVLEPVECEQCYTLEFETDATGKGKTTTNILLTNLNVPPYLGVATEVNEMGDGYLFSDVLYFITRYEYDSSNAKLKFFYQKEETNYYLLFNKLPQ